MKATFKLRLAQLEDRSKRMMGIDYPSSEAFHEASQRIGWRLLWPQLDTLYEQGRKLEDLREPTPYPSSMFEWARIMLAEWINQALPWKEHDDIIFENYCRMSGWNVAERHKEAVEFVLLEMEFLDSHAAEQGPYVMFMEVKRANMERATDPKEKAGMQKFIDLVNSIKELKRKIAVEKLATQEPFQGSGILTGDDRNDSVGM